ncbi:MAG: hypothetical protein AAFR76_07520 [Planctomycetota bacterium]
MPHLALSNGWMNAAPDEHVGERVSERVPHMHTATGPVLRDAGCSEMAVELAQVDPLVPEDSTPTFRASKLTQECGCFEAILNQEHVIVAIGLRIFDSDSDDRLGDVEKDVIRSKCLHFLGTQTGVRHQDVDRTEEAIDVPQPREFFEREGKPLDLWRSGLFDLWNGFQHSLVDQLSRNAVRKERANGVHVMTNGHRTHVLGLIGHEEVLQTGLGNVLKLCAAGDAEDDEAPPWQVTGVVLGEVLVGPLVLVEHRNEIGERESAFFGDAVELIEAASSSLHVAELLRCNLLRCLLVRDAKTPIDGLHTFAEETSGIRRVLATVACLLEDAVLHALPRFLISARHCSTSAGSYIL